MKTIDQKISDVQWVASEITKLATTVDRDWDVLNQGIQLAHHFLLKEVEKEDRRRWHAGLPSSETPSPETKLL